MPSKKVLVVDDNEAIRLAFKFILDHSQYDVVSARNGREAWGLLEKGEKFDYIISDYNMPEMNGIGLLLNVRNDPRTGLSKIPFILMSGNDTVISNGDPIPLMEMCAKYDARFLGKPFSLERLRSLMPC